MSTLERDRHKYEKLRQQKGTLRASIRAALIVLDRIAPWASRTLERLDTWLRLSVNRGDMPDQLHVGCGLNLLDGWLNADLLPTADLYVDVRRPLPFQDETFEAMYAEELIEHLSLQDGMLFLREAHRCLRPGGKIRLTTPNLRFVSQCFRREPAHLRAMRSHKETFLSEDSPLDDITPAKYLNDMFHMHNHRFLYDFTTLCELLQTAGFTDIRREEYGESRWNVFQGLDSHAGRLDTPSEATLFVEACRG